MSRLDVIRKYRVYARRVKEIVKEYDGGARVLLFGSTVKGTYTGASDIDILIVSERRDLEYPIKLAIKQELLDVPLEIHFTTPEEFEQWYKRFLDRFEEV